jgi:hypothetical protein
VELYSLQQKLAKLQSGVEKIQEQLQVETKSKIDAANELKRVTDEHANKIDDSQQLHSKWYSHLFVPICLFSVMMGDGGYEIGSLNSVIWINSV